ncbi:undecaprenyl-diphosphooligosaccharide--protein glycotransferase [Campylobacter blaseri]|uniref:General glycosylation pathway protein n=1 Tax=Campylobacter blaseri TaxID=2042961 RepID=A0A2P8R1F9_9BACT|nr:STT3 domain-containing protein [Campylobacter blaseri]PSM52330.1 general glycosylation pathway protein [Campylobacter blaseri]PSM54096.1 general glycosylation pathway protein [Campylobacter blaseri]QKF85538.1 undecaprenyl-diphosphooligosaccharide--protein glycotransferase [Campylobacter blaseri]
MQENLRIKFIIYALVAFVFGIVSRYYWIYWAGGNEDFIFNGSVMINTNDGYYFAEGAKDILDNFVDKNPNSNASKQGLSIVTAFIYKILPFKFENILLYLSGFFSSLLVFPMLLISKEYKSLEFGFIGSLVSVVAMSYYNRTMYGYYDTDMLTIVLPMFVLWGMIRVVNSKNEKDIIIAPIFMLLYFWWYPASYSLNIAFISMIFFYTIIFDRKNIINYKLCIMMLAATTNLNLSINFAIIIALYILFLKNIKLLYIQIIAFFVFTNFIFNGGLGPIIGYLNSYVFRTTTLSDDNLMFFNVTKTIPELSQIDKTYFMERISSHVVLFALSIAGYVVLCFKNRSFLLSLPMIGLGFLALKGGLRFTIYAVPIMGLGLGFLYIYLINFFKIDKYIKIAIISLLTILSLIPALQHIYNYKSSTVFSKSEVEILEKLKTLTTRDDYVLAWWDYGYPIRYYTNANTLIDGAIHSGEVNFPVSFTLTKDQTSSANMARLAVEYLEKRLSLEDEKKANLPTQDLKWMMKDYGFKNVNDFLLNVSFNDFNPPKKTREIYYYLPLRMMNIFTTVNYFSNLDLNTGKIKNSGVFFTMYPTSKDKDGIILNGNILLNNNFKTIITPKKEVIKVKNFYQVGYDKDGKYISDKQVIDSSGDLNIIFLINDGFFILLDDYYLNSTYVKLFFLQDYDSELFEPVILNRHTKIYKLKR